MVKIHIKPDEVSRLEKLFAAVIKSLREAEPNSGIFNAKMETKFDSIRNEELGITEDIPNGWFEFEVKGTWKEKK